MTPRPDVLIGNLTHVGMERSNNQDYYGYYEPEDDATFDRLGRLIVVCDGMGGHAGGEVASQLATTTIIQAYQQNQTGNVLEALKSSIEQANRAVWDQAAADAHLKGMGTTVVALVLKQGIAYFAHVGDSRNYLIRDGQLHQMTLDHSLVQQMVNEGLIREEDMENHPEKNVILRSLGVKPDVDVELNYQEYAVGDIFLLSSDGLTGLVSKDECLQIATHLRDQPMQACAQLVDLANRYGGYDNITVQMAHVKAMSPQEAEAMGLGQLSAADAAKLAGPTETELAANEAPAAGGGGHSITGVVSADEVARIKAQIKAQQVSAAPGAGPGAAKAKAVGGGGGGGLGAPVVGGVAVAAVLIGLLAGGALTGSVAGKRAKLTELRAFAAPSAGSIAYKAAETKSKLALEKADTLLGRFTAGGDLDAAISAFRPLARKRGGGEVDDEALATAKAEATKARQAADTAKASVHATEAFDAAAALLDQVEGAAPSEQAMLYSRAAAGFRGAARQAIESQARTHFERQVRSYDDALAEAERKRASEYVGELIDEAKKARSYAQELLDGGDPVHALDRMEYAISLTQAAARWAPIIEKKKVAKAKKRFQDAEAAAQAAGALGSSRAKQAVVQAKALAAKAEASLAAGDSKGAIETFGAAASRYKLAASIVGQETASLKRGAAQRARQGAIAARGQAEAAGGARFDPPGLAAAKTEFQAAEQAFAAGHFGDAASGFLKARGLYRDVQARSVTGAAQQKELAAVEAARALAVKARAGADAAGAQKGSGGAAYASATKQFAKGETSADAGAYEQALAAYRQAAAGFRAAATAAARATAAPPSTITTTQPPTTTTVPPATGTPKAEALAAKREAVDAKAKAAAAARPNQLFLTVARKKEQAAESSMTKGAYAKAAKLFRDATKYYLKAAGATR